MSFRSVFLFRLFTLFCLLLPLATVQALPIVTAPVDDRDMEGLLQESDDALLPGSETPLLEADIHRYATQARKLIREARFVEAISLCGGVLQMRQGDSVFRACLAAAYRGAGDEEGFRREQALFVQESPGSAEIHLFLADAYMAMHAFDEAEAVYREGLARAREKTGLRMGLAALYLQRQRLTEAADLFRKVLQQDRLEHRDFLNASFALCRIDLHEGRLGAAIRRAQNVIELYPPLPQGYLLLAEAYRKDGKPAQAISVYQQLLEINPDVAEAYHELALTYMDDLKDAGQALHFASEGARRFPRDAKSQDVLGWVYFNEGRYEDAQAGFLKAVGSSGHHASYHYHLGLAWERLGRSDEAVRAFRRALDLIDAKKEASFAQELQQCLKRVQHMTVEK